jgi:hypothetical protein
MRDLTGEPDPVEKNAQIIIMREEVALNTWRLRGIGGAQRDPAATLRSNQRRSNRESMPFRFHESMFLKEARREVELQIGRPGCASRPHKPARLRYIRSQHPFLVEKVASDVADALRGSQADRLRRLVHDAGDRVILQIPSHPGQVRHDLDAVTPQLVSRTDAGEQQQLRRVDRAAAQQDLAIGADAEEASALDEFDACRAIAFKKNPRGLCAGANLEVRSRGGRAGRR